MNEFTPELQRDWSLEELRLVRCDEAFIRVSSRQQHESPDPLGRHGTDVISYPELFSVQCEAEFSFRDCIMVRTWSELAISTIESSPDDVFEGKTFRRFSKSVLLTAHADLAGGPVYHYELVCDEIIDILCTKPPTVVLREVSSGKTLQKSQ